MAATVRTPSTPYARRLARERGIPLASLRGSGPNGRIVAADVARHGAAPADRPEDTRPAAVSPLSAFAATIDLRAARTLLADFAEAGHAFTLDDIVLRAIAVALPDGAEGIAVEVGPRQVMLGSLAAMSLGAIHSARLAAVDGAGDETAAVAALSLRVRDGAAVRPVLVPLLPGRSMRLVLSANADSAEALLVSDPARVDEFQASDVLERFRRNLDKPLGMLA